MIKLITLSSIFLLFPLLTFAQGDINVPELAKTHLLENFISAYPMQWSLESDGNFKAVFTHQSQNKSVSYSKDGLWISTETILFKGQQPLPILNTLSRYSEYEIEHIVKIDNIAGSTFTARVRVKYNIYEMTFDDSGKIKSKQKVYEFDNDDSVENSKRRKVKPGTRS